MITKEEYQEYIGSDAPSNFNRLLGLATNLITNRYNTDNLSPRCSDVLKMAIIEQIYFMHNSNVDENKEVKSVSLGNASESYELKKGYDEIIGPIVHNLLKNARCNFMKRDIKSSC